MTAHRSVPEAGASGAPGSGGQGPGAGELASLKAQLEQKCMPIVNAINDILQEEAHNAYIIYAFDTFRYLATGSDDENYVAQLIADVMDMEKEEVDKRVKVFNELKTKSVGKVIETCDVKQRLLDFAPSLRTDVSFWENKARKKGHKEIIKLLERLKAMTVEEFLREWEGIMDKLIEKDYDKLAVRILQAIDYESRLADAMLDEIEILATELLGATEDQIEELLDTMAGC